MPSGKVAPRAATVGVVEHGNSAVLVTVAAGGEILDRRRIDLTRDLPTHPYADRKFKARLLNRRRCA
jgi:hypothetical protein